MNYLQKTDYTQVPDAVLSHRDGGVAQMKLRSHITCWLIRLAMRITKCGTTDDCLRNALKQEIIHMGGFDG